MINQELAKKYINAVQFAAQKARSNILEGGLNNDFFNDGLNTKYLNTDEPLNLIRVTLILCENDREIELSNIMNLIFLVSQTPAVEIQLSFSAPEFDGVSLQYFLN